ncbi:type VII secretion target [Nocardia sp. CDC160]|uniref:type VII secretion target n=1 Tax=Nocardia sp. CDC160 TaxID=3112166 RepID=UPI002DB830E8|nr:type VII secretion target [Nocardia sp. CDC160]MEC3919255.1 type VII secretion target [Nocardia sp. CDC160]
MDFAASPDVIRGHAATLAQVAAQVGTGTAVDQVGLTAAAVPVFGLIGQDFLGALVGFAVPNHVASGARLAGVFGAMSGVAATGAVNYDMTDAASAAGLTAAV